MERTWRSKLLMITMTSDESLSSSGSIKAPVSDLWGIGSTSCEFGCDEAPQTGWRGRISLSLTCIYMNHADGDVGGVLGYFECRQSKEMRLDYRCKLNDRVICHVSVG